MESRRIRGEGVAHEQDWVRERIEDAGDTNEYAEAAQRLEQEVQDLSTGGNAGGVSYVDDVDTRRTQATLPTEQIETRQGAALDATTQSPVDPNQLPPSAEARRRVTNQSGGGTMGSSSES